MKLTQDQQIHAAHEMERSGGGFASALAKTFYVADGHNQRTLVSAFSELFEKFYEYSVEHDARVAATQPPVEVRNPGWVLMNDLTNRPVCVGDKLLNFRGETRTIMGGRPPHKQGSTGRIETDEGSFYPSVCDCTWKKV